MDELLIDSAIELALRHRLRTMDALHLASAKTLQSLGEVVIVSADSELVAGAVREGLRTLNPAVAVS